MSPAAGRLPTRAPASVGANLEAELRSQNRSEIEQLLMAQDCATQVLDAEQRPQPRARQVHLRERCSRDVQLVDRAIDEGNRAQLGGPGVDAADLALLEHHILELCTGEVHEPELAAVHDNAVPGRAGQHHRPETASRYAGVAPGGVAEVGTRSV